MYQPTSSSKTADLQRSISRDGLPYAEALNANEE